MKKCISLVLGIFILLTVAWAYTFKIDDEKSQLVYDVEAGAEVFVEMNSPDEYVAKEGNVTLTEVEAGLYKFTMPASNVHLTTGSGEVIQQSVVTLDNQGATTAGTTSVTATFGSAMPAINLPIKTGYTFGGYYTETNGGGTKYYNADGSSAINWDKTEDTTLYAKWTPGTMHTLNFDSMGGSEVASKTVTYGSTYGELPTPTREGYTFDGWYNVAEIGDKTLTAPSNQNSYSYAVLSQIDPGVNYTVSMDSATLNRGSATRFTTSIYDITTSNALDYDAIVLGNNIEYTLTSPDNIVEENDIRLFVDAGESGATAGNSITFKNVRVSTTGTTVKTRYTSSSIVETPKNHTLYAKWTPGTMHTLNFDSMGGSEVASKTVTYGSTYGELPTPTREGYTFDGWYNVAEIGDKTLTATSSEDYYYHAMLSQIDPGVSYTISMDSATLNSGSATMFTTSIYDLTTSNALDYDTIVLGNNIEYTLTSPDNIVEENDIRLLIDAGESGVTAGNSITFKNVRVGTTGTTTETKYTSTSTVTTLSNHTLYAKWTPINYTVAYNKNGGSGTMSNSSHTYDVSKALSANKFTRTDYKFTGWNTKSDGSGTSYTDKQSVSNLTSTDGATVTLYAQWKSVYPAYSYGGTSSKSSDSTYWYIYLKTEGTKTFKFTEKNYTIDVFLVGGGGAGASGNGGGGGGGGRTVTATSVSATKGTSYDITIGAGGSPVAWASGGDGGTTSAFGKSAAGGSGGQYVGGGSNYKGPGGSGGSGGGGGTYSETTSHNGGTGGSNGSNGYDGAWGGVGGSGLDSTTYAFGDSSQTLYAGGGGGSARMSSQSGGTGGDGGGGNGAAADVGATAGGTNTGGGGGAGRQTAKSGGSGIVIIRGRF